MTKYITLDWDMITIEEARSRMYQFCEEFPNFSQLVLSLSATKGFHLSATFSYHVPNLLIRRKYKDDGRRVVNDIINCDNNAHNILWSRKVVSGQKWKTKQLIVITNPVYYDGTRKREISKSPF